uniref:Uncharacterized protein n=1 Tax=Anopheles farauti TaxID=69004 RepID=A0A182QFH4_9DIPT
MGFERCRDDTALMPLVLRLLQVIGVWDEPRDRYKYAVVFVCYLFGIVIPKVFFGYPSLEASIRGYAELIVETNVFGGMLMFYLRYDQLKLLVYELRSFFGAVFRNCNPSETSIGIGFIQVNQRIHKCTVFYCLYMCCICMVYCIAPLWSNYSSYRKALDRDNASSFEFSLYLEQGFYWLDNRTSLLGYSVCAVFMIPLIYLCAYTGTVKVVAVFNTIKYCQTAFGIVVAKLAHLKTLPEKRQRTDAMLEVFDLHQRALYCAKLLELVLQPLLLLQFILCILSWCTMMLYFVMSSLSVKFVNMFLLFLFVTIETFGYCYLGTKLSDESINVGRALYDTNWNEFDCGMQKKVRFAIMRTQCRVGLTAAKFCYADMEQFRAMLNTSYSLFVVLKDSTLGALVMGFAQCSTELTPRAQHQRDGTAFLDNQLKGLASTTTTKRFFVPCEHGVTRTLDQLVQIRLGQTGRRNRLQYVDDNVPIIEDVLFRLDKVHVREDDRHDRNLRLDGRMEGTLLEREHTTLRVPGTLRVDVHLRIVLGHHALAAIEHLHRRRAILAVDVLNARQPGGRPEREEEQYLALGNGDHLPQNTPENHHSWGEETGRSRENGAKSVVKDWVAK